MTQAPADQIDPIADAPTIIRDGARSGTPLLSVDDLQVEFAGSRPRRPRGPRAVVRHRARARRSASSASRARARASARCRCSACCPSGSARSRPGPRSSRARTSSTCPRSELRKIRGAKIAMIFQDPLSSLNPVLTIGRQITEALETHSGISEKEAQKRAIELLELVGIPERGQARQRLPAPVQRRDAPARDDRDGAQLRAEPAHRRRADDRARRHDPGPDPGAAAPAPRPSSGWPS